ncbi:hypothetical protein L1887_00872 [Cichorium endivia]|nr:hypothetical protein L1887_00872 [Cichorium endivia]
MRRWRTRDLDDEHKLSGLVFDDVAFDGIKPDEFSELHKLARDTRTRYEPGTEDRFQQLASQLRSIVEQAKGVSTVGVPPNQVHESKHHGTTKSSPPISVGGTKKAKVTKPVTSEIETSELEAVDMPKELKKMPLRIKLLGRWKQTEVWRRWPDGHRAAYEVEHSGQRLSKTAASMIQKHCNQQPSGWECAYYVMRWMLEFVLNRQNEFPNKTIWNDKKPFPDCALNEIIVTWISRV